MSNGPIIDRRGPKATFNLQLIAYAWIVILSAVGIYVAVNNTNQIADQQRELRAGLIRSCQQNGNPLRKAVTGQLETQIHQSQNSKFLRTFFPQIPEDQLNALVHAAVARDKAEIKQIAPVDCAAIYR